MAPLAVSSARRKPSAVDCRLCVSVVDCSCRARSDIWLSVPLSFAPTSRRNCSRDLTQLGSVLHIGLASRAGITGPAARAASMMSVRLAPMARMLVTSLAASSMSLSVFSPPIWFCI